MSEILTLKENRDFQRLYRRGKSYVSPILVTYIMKNKTDNLRYGITTGKKDWHSCKAKPCEKNNKSGILTTEK